jgi:hypothetical protein
MKHEHYSIRLSETMKKHIVEEARKLQLLPSEYLRNLILRDMEIKGYGKATQ